MSSAQDLEYWQTRAEIERELSRSAPDRKIAAIHLDLAARYDALSARAQLKFEVAN
jgi:hypothetical protein